MDKAKEFFTELQKAKLENKGKKKRASPKKTKEETGPLVIGALVILKGCNFQLGYHSQMVN